jgi:hypothetical protein
VPCFSYSLGYTCRDTYHNGDENGQTRDVLQYSLVESLTASGRGRSQEGRLRKLDGGGKAEQAVHGHGTAARVLQPCTKRRRAQVQDTGGGTETSATRWVPS